MKQILIVTASLREGSNSAALAERFAAGAKAAGNRVETVNLIGKTLGFCRGCMTCQKTCACVLRDDASAIAEQIRTADTVVFATPIYYYEMSGQMKTLLDRCNPIYPAEYAFRDVYLLATAADTDEAAMDGAIKGLEGWISCFPRARLAGVLRGCGADERGAVAKMPELLAAAYAMGNAIR